MSDDKMFVIHFFQVVLLAETSVLSFRGAGHESQFIILMLCLFTFLTARVKHATQHEVNTKDVIVMVTADNRISSASKVSSTESRIKLTAKAIHAPSDRGRHETFSTRCKLMSSTI